MSFPSGHALVIGVGTYQHAPRFDVPITAADAEEVAVVLRDQRACGYPEAQVSLLRDAGATRDGVLATLDEIAHRVTERDTLLLFYSGHGSRGDDGRYYLTTHDTIFAGGKVSGGTGVSEQDLLEKLQAIRANRVLLIFNACHSGAISPTLDVEEPFTGQVPPGETTAALLATGQGRIIITACREQQYSFVGAGPRTIFAQALVDGLRGEGISAQRGYISAFDLYTRLYFSVGERVKQAIPADIRARYGGTQEPELTVIKGVGPFAVALHRGATTLGEFEAPARPAEGTALREIDKEESRAAFQHIQSGGVSFGQRSTIDIGGSVVGGSLHNINTGGDYAGGDIDKSQSIRIGSGTFYGPVVANNTGTITYGVNQPHPSSTSLEQALTQVQQAIGQARQRGEDELADDLEGVVLPLRAALKAQADGKGERRSAKLREAQEAIGRLASTYPTLASIAAALAQAR